MFEENAIDNESASTMGKPGDGELQNDAATSDFQDAEGCEEADQFTQADQDSDSVIDEGSNADNAAQGISDEQLDEIADIAIAVLKDILKYFNVGEITIDEYEGDEGELILDITGNDLAILIGRHGRTLDALQFLVSAITVRKLGYRYPVIIDVESYKNRQRQKLESLARSSAKKAVSQGRSVKLRPMTPYERRIIHVALRDDTRVETASEGEGTARHVVIVPVK